jgi:hypothetical protein
MGHYTHHRRRGNLLQGLGLGPADRPPSRLAAQRRRWDGQMPFLLHKDYRVIPHDRRGHGRSAQTAACNEMDTYAGDLAALVQALDRKDAAHGPAEEQPWRLANRGLRRLPGRRRRQSRTVLRGRTRGPFLRLQPSGRRRLAGRRRQSVAPKHDKRDKSVTRPHQNSLRHRLRRGPAKNRHPRAGRAWGRRSDRAVRGLTSVACEAAQSEHSSKSTWGARAASALRTPKSSTPTCSPSPKAEQLGRPAVSS